MSLHLIGMRGAGKSAAGALAAEQLGVDFVDADRQIERVARMTVAELFARQGEPAFRELELEVTLELLARPDHIVATGGGCVTMPQVRRALEASPGVIWLRAPAEVLASRIAGSDRPSLTGADPEQELGALLERRQRHYMACAGRIVDTERRGVREVALVLQQLWQQLPHHDLR